MVVLHFKDEKGAGQLDLFILQKQPWLTSGQLHKFLRQNKIKLNGKKMPLSTKLVKGDEVQLYLPQKAEASLLDIVFENADLLVVNKPVGMLTLFSKNQEDEQTSKDNLLMRLRKYAQQAEEPFIPLLCHRLDRGTSGLVIVAKNEMVEELINGLIRQHVLRKCYFAVVQGVVKPPSTKLTAWHFKDAKRGIVRIYDEKVKGAKPIETSYKTIAGSGRFTLLEIELITGRTHQIRAHLAHIGHPILGDGKYGSGQMNKELKCKYQCLCAQKIVLPSKIENPRFAYLQGLSVQCKPPWYYGQILSGELR